ncbi:glycosyltransferase [Streptomyces hygroscopicus]|uniref:glycosyltransferase n=1 Tax=Streptomyces hygroscopicus TaxID=1912 RepID=UPI0007676393|nr:glycosyltransferase [Streptomyces hygroscopicus]
MNISALRNPYDYRNPVRDAAFFAGRGEEVGVIKYELDQAAVDRPSVCVVLHGPRAAGKTSLLNATEWMAEKNGFVTVRVELIEGDGEPTVFFRKVYEELVSAITADGPDELSVPGPAAVRRVMAGAAEAASVAPLEFPEAVALAGQEGRVPEAALRADLAYFIRLLGRPIVLLVDEAQLMAHDARALSALRFLTSRVDGLVLVLAGTSGLIDRITDVHSPILRQFKEIAVRGFVEWEDIHACIERPLLSVGIHGHASAGVVSALRQLTDGNPYEIQLYCHEMFARWQRGAAERMELTAEVLEGIRSRMESGRDVLDRPLIRAVRAMNRHDLIAFNVLTSALGHATAEETWFAYKMAGPPEITRAQYDLCRQSLIADGILTDEDPVRFAVPTELFDEIYARLWTVGTVGSVRHAQYTSRNPLHPLLVQRLDHLLCDIATGPLRLFPTCCPAMNGGHIEEIFKALETLPEEGPDATPRINLLHDAILRAGEPSALDLTTVTCTFSGHTVERWLYAADTDDVVLADSPDFKTVVERVAQLGGELTTDRVRVPLRSWPARSWFQRATGRLRTELADNHLNRAYEAYSRGDIPAAVGRLRDSFTLAPGWEQANNLTYLILATGNTDDALTWAERALDLADAPLNRALSLYNAAMARLTAGDRTSAADHLVNAAEVLDTVAIPEYTVSYLLLPDPDDAATLHEETDVDLVEAVRHAGALLGVGPGSPGLPRRRDEEGPEKSTLRHQGADHPAPGRRAPVILSVATEWASSHGGLSTFNRDLCRALADAGALVFCVVLAAASEEVAAAAEAGVTLLPAPDMPGASEDMRLTSRPKLPAGMLPDLVVGHGRITGPVAKKIADDFYPMARRLHFVHMAPDEIEWYKPDRGTDAGMRAEERTDIERALGRGAHRVVAVGPRLHDQFLAEFAGTEALPPLRLDPGFDVTAPSVPRTPPGGSPLRVLMIGRTEDARLKGVDLAATACGRVATWWHEDGLRRLRLLVRGAPEAAVEQQRAEIVAWAGNPQLEVVVRAYASAEERVANDLNSASLVIVPSRSEGFGLVGVEAITQGVPVLVSSGSGLAQLLREALGHEAADQFVVSMSGDDEKDTGKWARAIDRKLRDREGAFRQTAELRARLAERVPWSEAAAVVLGAVAQR